MELKTMDYVYMALFGLGLGAFMKLTLLLWVQVISKFYSEGFNGLKVLLKPTPKRFLSEWKTHEWRTQKYEILRRYGW